MDFFNFFFFGKASHSLFLDGVPAQIIFAFVAIASALTIGWMSLMILLFTSAAQEKDVHALGRAEKMCLQSAAIWFVLDSGACIFLGVPGNVLLNVAFYASFALLYKFSKNTVKIG